MSNLFPIEKLDKYPNKALRSNTIFDSLEITKPETGISGCVVKDSVQESSLKGSLHTPIIAETPNFHKGRGVFVSDEGFIKLPRSLIVSAAWRDLTMKQQKFFLYILERVQFTPRVEKHRGIEIVVVPGQLFISYRSLVADYNHNIKYQKEKIDLSFLQRCVSTFLRNGWADTRTDTGMTLLTITYPELYDHFKSLTDTPTDTKTIQRRYNVKERKKDKNVKETINDADSSLSNKNENQEASYDPLPSVFDDDEKKDIPQATEDDFKKELSVILDFVRERKIPLKEKDLERWIKNRGGHVVISNLVLMTNQKKTINKPAAWMERALKEDWAQLAKNEPINRKFAEDFKKQNNWSDLMILKKYCTIDRTGYDIPLNFDPETFRYTIESKFENLSRSHTGEQNY